jgi:hypothetical protein
MIRYNTHTAEEQLMFNYAVRSRIWNYDSQSLIFSADASDLGWPPGTVPTELTLQSATGTVQFKLTRTETDTCGDCVSWLYTAVDAVSQKANADIAALKKLRARVFND